MRTPTRSRASDLLAPLVLLASLVLGLQPHTVAHATRAAAPAGDLNLVQYVDPFIGTDVGGPDYGINNSVGDTFPGAAYPRGMVQWSPDTTNAPGGYRYGDSTIHGFSLTHFSGRGCSAYQDFPFTPVVGALTGSPVTTPYGSAFSHNNEIAQPGYYSVKLDNGVDVSLTVTPRTGYALFTYPLTSAATLLINAGGSATGDNATGTGVQIVGSDQVTGSASSGNFCGNNSYTVYFAAQFDHAFGGFGTWNGATVSPSARSSSGSQSGAYLTFDATQNQTIGVKVGISFVSVANAQANLAAEDPGWDFNATRGAASDAWNARLNQIQVSGGSADEQTIFYTALYHTLFHPNIFSDVNGQYIGFDGQVHQATGYTQYENFAGWDNYRSLMRLRALLDPKETSDMVQSLVADAQQGGGGLPRWEVANDNSGGMIGDSQDVVIASAFAFGATAFDTQGALRAMLLGASQPGTLSGKDQVREGLADYLSHGYVNSSAAMTLEYTTDDFSIAMFAKALGDAADYATYLQRAQNWKNLFDASNGYIVPRAADGTFIPFDPTSQNGFREGDGAQYTWMVPYNLRALFADMGGDAQVIARLDTHFTQLNAGPDSPYAFMGNEPEFEVPWEYDFAGAPYRTQAVVRQIELQLFHATPGGLVGNDDGGALSSWYVLAALGLYPEIPGVAGFVVGSPLFPAATVHLGDGNVLQINGQGAADAAPYVQSLSLNGQSYASPWIPYSAISGGATLQFTLGGSPNTAWGADPAQTPPSYDATGAPLPYNGSGITDDGNTGPGSFDGDGYSFSAQALAAAGLTTGQPVTYNGITFQWPGAAPGTPDEVAALGQTIALSASPGASALAFLGAASYGPSSGAGTITYSDGSTQGFTLSLSDWTLNGGAASPVAGDRAAVAMPYRNAPGNGRQLRATYVFYTAVPLQAGKAPVSVTLPTDANLHIFALAVGAPTGASPPFATSFESGDPQPAWANTVDMAAPVPGIANVIGICCGLAGPEAGVRHETAHTGAAALMYSGLDSSATTSYAYLKLFDLSSLNIKVGANTTLSYWIYPQSPSTSPVSVSGNNSSCVAIDLVFSDNTDSRGLGAADENGHPLTPSAQCGRLTLDAWNHVTAGIGAVAAGKTLARIDMGYDQGPNAGGYRGYIDDISIQ